MHAVSRVTTTGTGGKPEKHIIRVERDQQIWKTVARDLDDGSFKPHAQVSPHDQGQLLLRQPGMPSLTPAPSASSAPSGAK